MGRLAAGLPLSRVQQCWLLLAQAVAAVPLWWRLPFWVTLVCLGALGWRAWMLWSGRMRVSRWLTVGLLGGLCFGLVAQWGNPARLEPMIALLLGCCAFKCLEMRRIREARTVLFLGYFIAAVGLIFEQRVLDFCLAVAAVLVTLAAQNMAERDPWRQYSLRGFSWGPLRSVGRLAVLSIPLTLLIFVFTPRLPSFWSIPLPDERLAQSGVSDRLNPGSISALTRSGKLAFRVGFEGPVPPARELYWRALVLSDFDGATWGQRGTAILQDGAPIHWAGPRRPAPDWRRQVRYRGEPLRYRVYQEPSGQHWLFAIAAPVSDEFGIGHTAGLRLVSRQPVTQRVMYQVRSYPDYRLDPVRLSAAARARNLYLPAGSNPQTRALAASWRAEGLGAAAIVARLFAQFGREYRYTLSPGEYGRHAVDEFLLVGKRGFCEHFAAATVLLLRAAGVPARVVVGYQGGELNPEGNYLLVHQYDAHAWGEYWEDRRGWVRIDPTAAVAPERIEYGARPLLVDEPAFLADEFFSLNQVRHVAVLNWLRLNMDNLNYLWLSWVLGYDSGRQTAFFGRVFGVFFAYPWLWLVLLGSGLVLVLAVLCWRGPRRRRSRIERLFLRLRRGLVRRGLVVRPGHSPARLAVLSERAGLVRAAEICRLFDRHLYANRECERQIRRRLRGWR